MQTSPDSVQRCCRYCKGTGRQLLSSPWYFSLLIVDSSFFCFTIVVVYSLKGTSIIRRQTLPYLSSLCRNNLQLLEQFQQSQQVRITLFKGRKSRCHSLGITSLGTVMFDGHNSTPLQQVQDIPQFWILNLVVVSNKYGDLRLQDHSCAFFQISKCVYVVLHFVIFLCEVVLPNHINMVIWDVRITLVRFSDFQVCLYSFVIFLCIFFVCFWDSDSYIQFHVSR